MADRLGAMQRPQLRLVEDLRDEPELAQREDASVLGGRDPRGLLTPVLEGVEGEVGEPRHIRLGCVYAEHATLVARPFTGGDRLLRSHWKWSGIPLS